MAELERLLKRKMVTVRGETFEEKETEQYGLFRLKRSGGRMGGKRGMKDITTSLQLPRRLPGEGDEPVRSFQVSGADGAMAAAALSGSHRQKGRPPRAGNPLRRRARARRQPHRAAAGGPRWRRRGAAAGGWGRAGRPLLRRPVCPTHWNSFPGHGPGRCPARRRLLAKAGRHLPPPPSPLGSRSCAPFRTVVLWYHRPPPRKNLHPALG